MYICTHTDIHTHMYIQTHTQRNTQMCTNSCAHMYKKRDRYTKTYTEHVIIFLINNMAVKMAQQVKVTATKLESDA